MQTILNRNRIFYIATGGTGVNNTATPKIDTGNVGLGSDLYRNGDRGATPNSTPTPDKPSDWWKWLVGGLAGGLLTGLITWLINEVPKWFKSKEAKKAEVPKEKAANATRPEVKAQVGDRDKLKEDVGNHVIETEKPTVDKVNTAKVKIVVGKEKDKIKENSKKLTLILPFEHNKRTFSKDEEYKLKMAQIFNNYLKEKGIGSEVFTSADKSGKPKYNMDISTDRLLYVLGVKNISEIPSNIKATINGENQSTNNYDALNRTFIQNADLTKSQYEELTQRMLDAGITQEQINSSLMDGKILTDNKVLDAMVNKTNPEADNGNTDKNANSLPKEVIAEYKPDYTGTVVVVEPGKDIYKDMNVTYKDSNVKGMTEDEKNSYLVSLGHKANDTLIALENNNVFIANGKTEVDTSNKLNSHENITIGGNSTNTITIGGMTTLNTEKTTSKGTSLSF